jgi:hypothetical protein
MLKHRSDLEAASNRIALPPAGKPYWQRVAPGIALGYRRNSGSAGTWNVRSGSGKAAWTKRIALADDYEPAAPPTVLHYFQARDLALKLARQQPGAPVDDSRPITVGEALDRYKANLEKHGSGTPRAIKRRAYNATWPLKHLEHSGLLTKPIQLLTARELDRWRDTLKMNPATINRMMKGLWAAFELAALHDSRIRPDEIKKGVEPLPEGDPKLRDMLPHHAVEKIVAGAYAHDHDLGLLMDVLAQTGTRPVQAARLLVADLISSPEHPSVKMRRSAKGGGKKRAARIARTFRVEILPELARKLRARAAGRKPGEPLLLQGDGQPWGDSPSYVYRRPMRDVIAAAGLDPDVVTPYWLRHTSIHCQLLANIPIRVVAANHDTSVQKIEENYTHNITEHSDAISRQALQQRFAPTLADNVISLR